MVKEESERLEAQVTLTVLNGPTGEVQTSAIMDDCGSYLGHKLVERAGDCNVSFERD
jgi:hypothetical protein